MITEVKAPNQVINNRIEPVIFLAGSIEQGTAKDWQSDIIGMLKLACNLPALIVVNPRREDWNASVKQEYTDPVLYQQVNWELENLEKADIILMYLDSETKSPISLLELGLFAKSGKLHVVCDPGFWRQGNVEIVCTRYNIPMYKNFSEFYKDYLKYKKW